MSRKTGQRLDVKITTSAFPWILPPECPLRLFSDSHVGVKGRDGRAEELDRVTGEEQITVGWTRRKDGG